VVFQKEQNLANHLGTGGIEPIFHEKKGSKYEQ
jgi:hypothetical protein